MEISVYEGDAEEVIPVTRGDLMDLCATAYVDGACSIDDESRENVEVSTCHDTTAAVYAGAIFTCSECGAATPFVLEDGEPTILHGELRFCPNCGRKVIY